MVSGKGLRLRVVLVVGLVTAGVGYLLLRWWHLQGGVLPAPSWVSVGLLVLMAFGILFAGWPIRRALRGRATRRLDPLRAFRVLVLAQAAALTGVLVAGWYLAHVLVMLPDADAASVRTGALLSAAAALAGVLLSAFGLWVQSMCRIDPPADSPDEDDDPEPR